MEENEVKHVRRVRYGGTHPKQFHEKYKELQPEKYSEEVASIIQKGRTPAGMHISICVKEILEFLQIKEGQTGLDATLGYGGHSLEMLKRLNHTGRLYAVDVDPIESEKTKTRLENLGFGSDDLTIRQLNFADADTVLEPGKTFDFVLADLGLSSMQIDNPERGFTFKYDGPLDLRLNPEKGITAAQKLKDLSESELEEILVENSDEPYAKQIARAVFGARKSGVRIETTKQLAQIVEDALSFVKQAERKEAVKKSCQRVFQALRIEINREFYVLGEFLDKLPLILSPGGRVAILTFHSGEDRLVKKSFKQYLSDGVYGEIAKDVVRPSAQECYDNPRASSAKLRWAIRSELSLSDPD